MERFGINGWKPDQMEDISGRVFGITGGNSGIGLEAARILANREAEVLILCRNPEKGEKAIEEIKADTPQAVIRAIELDLADLSSVESAAKQVIKETDRLDALILNAGIMMPPRRQMTKDGFEMQIGVNHLGHFALARQLMPLVEKADGRIVSVASIAHKFGSRSIRFDDLHWERRYNPMAAYAQSKLANLLFIHELSKRLQNKGNAVKAIACHPGYSSTNLQYTGPGRAVGIMLWGVTAVLAQKAKYGSYPTVLAAADDRALNNGYYGPTGFQEFGGPVREIQPASIARDDRASARLWAVSEEATGVTW